ncbi:uncharacterized protein LOC134281866 [Saccostrea cucullata]|uniref:uncharacterized protein LOC134281866 n=2 Tax=Saccostrea cuccullata TaxID=36930 RepID=UPI002ED1A5DB
MEGCRAFKDLESVVQDLGLTSMESNSVQENLQNAKRYLKSELKVHVTRENPVADHCLSYALSSTDSNFKTLCDHNHDSSCQECVNMNTTLNFIKSKAEIHEWRNKEAVLYTVEESISAIRNWKSHVIRSRNQEEARSVIVDNMTNVDAVITCDWAMKFLPRKYREGQVDWFAKRGINWHITVSLLKHHCSYSTITHIHIFEQPTAQDAAVTSQILVDVSKDIMALKKDVTRLHFFSDNAGCYKSSSTLLTLQHELPSSIVSYNFCEAQNGKGPCDRRASHIKSIIKRHVNEGNDVTTAQHMKQAVDKENKDDLRVKVVTSVNILDATPRKSTIPCISQMYNFQFTESGLRMWKAYSVGKGKLLTWDHLSAPENSVELKTVAGWIGGGISEMEEETPEDTSEENPSRSSVLECPEGSCSKTFSTQKALENHVNMGNCSFRSDAKMNVSEKAKRMYADKILSFQPQRSVVLESHSNTDVCRCSELDMGWAIKENRQRVTFTSGQKAFMTEKFDIGKRTGNKVDPYIAAEEMRNCGLFSRSEFLSGQQISSFFSRLCQKEKRMTAADFCASEEEDRKDQIRNLLLDQNN